MSGGAGKAEGGRGEEWRRRFKRVPGLARAYRALRKVWGWTADEAAAGWWRLRGTLPLGRRAKHRVSAVWAEGAAKRSRVYAGEARQWLDSTEVLWNYVFPQFGGRHWYGYVAERYCPQKRSLGLSLCCGDGELERNLLRYGICEACEGVDISPGAIEVCRREAHEAGLGDRLRYRAADVERMRLEPHTYDVIVGWMALHHLTRLEHVCREVRRALKPGGIFIVNEYVGPARFQVPKRRVQAINRLLSELPEELRRLPEGGVKERFERPRLSQIVRHDPSEAVRSDRIVPTLRHHFRIVEQINYGGTLLNWLLADIVQNFRPEDPAHRAWLDGLYAAEREVLESGEFESDFAFVVCGAVCAARIQPTGRKRSPAANAPGPLSAGRMSHRDDVERRLVGRQVEGG